ncbi:MAG: ATP-binding cassette domain-containing protein, partial [Calditrichaeota bacterium]
VIAVEIGLRLLYDKIAFEQAFFILILAPEFYAPIRQLGARYHAGMEGIAAAERIFEICDVAAPVANDEKPRKAPNMQQIICFKDVTLVYARQNAPALKSISMELSPGKVTALVGPSGSGKTTLSHLLLRFLDPDGGAISLGKSTISEFDLQRWRDQIAWVPQIPYLFNQSITENLRIANPLAKDDTLEKVARQANIHDFIMKLPDGYHTIIGERGTRLSGGQAQRLALARAFLKDAPILILDEPTANMDPQLETQLIASMQDLMRDRTVFIIAHRLNTVRSADKIVFLQGGEIVESGSFESLLQKDGFFVDFIKTAEMNT